MRLSHNGTRLLWPGVVLLAVLLTGRGVSAQAPKLKSTFDLNLPNQSRDGATRGLNGISFVGPGLIAVWYSEKNSEGALSRRDKLDKDDPWQLKMQLVDTDDGSVKQQLQWPTRKDSSSLAVQSDGQPVLLTGPVIHCLSPEFKEAKTFTLKNAGKPSASRLFRSSPGGKAIWLVEVSEMSNVETATRVNVDTCSPGPTLTLRRNTASLSGNDDLLVDTNTQQVGIWSPVKGWQLLYKHECCLANARFVAPNLVGVIQLDLDIRRHFLLVNLQGQLLLDDRMEQGYEFGNIYTSADARTAAVLIAERDIAGTPTGVEIQKTHAKIRFYDLVTRKRIGNMDINIPGEHLFGLAIAPDSSEFALLNGTKLSIYELRR